MSIPVKDFFFNIKYTYLFIIWKYYLYKFQGDGILIDKSYFNNVPSKNILNDYKPKNLSSDYVDNSTSNCIENMVINSNLDNDNNIK